MYLINRTLRWLAFSALVIGVATGMAACSSGRLSVTDYQQRVITVLRPQQTVEPSAPVPLNGLIPSLVQPFEVMRCLNEAYCLVPTEFTELRDVSDSAKFAIADEHGKLCQKGLKPPRALVGFHQQLCQRLDRIRLNLDTIELIAQQTLSVMSTAPGNDTSFAQKAAQRILSRRAAITADLRALEATDWLKAVFKDALKQIPELKSVRPSAAAN